MLFLRIEWRVNNLLIIQLRSKKVLLFEIVDEGITTVYGTIPGRLIEKVTWSTYVYPDQATIF